MKKIEYAKKTRGKTTVAHFSDLGVVDEIFLAVHSVGLTDAGVEMFARKSVSIAQSCNSNSGVGVCKTPEMLEVGTCVMVGADGAPSNNRMTRFDEMGLTVSFLDLWTVHCCSQLC